jgi:hypothetical protein
VTSGAHGERQGVTPGAAPACGTARPGDVRPPRSRRPGSPGRAALWPGRRGCGLLSQVQDLRVLTQVGCHVGPDDVRDRVCRAAADGAARRVERQPQRGGAAPAGVGQQHAAGVLAAPVCEGAGGWAGMCPLPSGERHRDGIATDINTRAGLVGRARGAPTPHAVAVPGPAGRPGLAPLIGQAAGGGCRAGSWVRLCRSLEGSCLAGDRHG